MLSAYGISRSGSRAEVILDGILARIMHSETSDNGIIFIWKPEQKPLEYDIFRVSGQGGEKRNIDDISSKEIQNAAIQVLCEQGSMQKSDLIKETAKKFGFTRTGSLIDVTVGFALDNAVNNGRLSTSQDGKITVA